MANQKKTVVPKNAGDISAIAQEFIDGAFSESNIGRVVYPTEISGVMKALGAKTHTGTVQNFIGILALGRDLRNYGWDVVQIKGGYYAFQKISDGKVDLVDIDKKLIKLIKYLPKK